MCAALSGASTAHAAVTFSPALEFASTQPMAAADFDGDGTVDVASATGLDLSVYYTDGAGGVVATERYPTDGSGSASLVAADFDGDGNTDVATANVASDNISVLLGDGAGGFAASTLFATGDMPRDLVAGDFDGDGEDDLVASAFADDALLFLEGDGDGGFAAGVPHSTGDQPNRLVSGDFDGDGRDDVAAAEDGSGSVDIMFGRVQDPDGTVFEPPVLVEAGMGIKHLATANLDGDGRTDLGILDRAFGSLTIVRGEATRVFAPTTRFAATSTSPEDLDFADFDGDGFDDLLLADNDRTAEGRHIVLNIGDGAGGFAFAFPRRFPALGGVFGVLAVHLTGDAEVDVVTTGGVFLGTALAFDPPGVEFPARRVGTPGSQVPVAVANAGTVAYEVVAADLLDGGVGQFAIELDSCAGSVLDVGESCSLALSFEADTAGLHEDVLVVETNVEAYGALVFGEALTVPSVGATPASVGFGESALGGTSAPQTVEVFNEDAAPVVVGDVTLVDADPSGFAIGGDYCAGRTLDSFESCFVSLTFRPSRTGPHSAMLAISHDGQDGLLSVPLAGTGTAGPPVLTASVAAIDFGEVRVLSRVEREVTVRNTSGGRISSVSTRQDGSGAAAFSSRPRGCARLSPGATCTVTVRFGPSRAGLHEAELTLVAGLSTTAIALAGTGTSTMPARTPDAAPMLRARLRSALLAWRRGGLAAALRRGFVVTGFLAPVEGTLRLSVRRGSRNDIGPVLARGRVRALPGAPTRIRARLTRAGRRALRTRRVIRLLAVLEHTAAQDRRRSVARASALIR